MDEAPSAEPHAVPIVDPSASRGEGVLSKRSGYLPLVGHLGEFSPIYFGLQLVELRHDGTLRECGLVLMCCDVGVKLRERCTETASRFSALDQRVASSPEFEAILAKSPSMDPLRHCSRSSVVT